MNHSESNDERVSKYMWRGLRYAGTSACAIFAGYFMEPQTTRKEDLLLLSIPILASVYFFIRYANRFPPSDASKKPANELGTFAQTEAVRLYFFLILIPYTAFVIYYVSKSEALSYKVLLSLALYVGLFIYYGKFLARYDSDGNLPLVRHWLIWPVILSIAIGLYYGLSFSNLESSFFPLFPIILIVILFVASLKLSRRLYIWITLLVILGVTTVSLLNQAGYFELPPMTGFSSMLFCVAASAYLAVFEAGSITAEVARRDGSDSRALQYAQATLAALTASVWLLPFYYIFSDYGSAFLIGFAVHALAAFIIWFYRGKTPYLQDWRWSDIKIVPGVLFLGLLVLSPTRLFNEQLTFHFLKDFEGWGIGILALLVFVLASQLVKDYIPLRDQEGISTPIYELFKERINFTRLLSFLCFIFCCGIALRFHHVDESSQQYSRAELAFLVYAICIFLCFVVEGREFFRPKRKSVQGAKSVVGILLIIRAFPSILISLVVFLPLYRAGLGIVDSLSAALPFFCAAAGGFSINDYYDVPKDKINKPYRAIPSGKLSPGLAFAFGVTLIGAACVSSFLVYQTTFQLALYLLSIAGVGLYNLVVKHFSLSKTILTASISVLPLLYVTATLSYPPVYLLVAIGGLLFLLGRELLMDIKDIEGDRLSGIRTLPMMIGPATTARVAFSFFTLCGVILIIFTIEVWSIRNAVLTWIILLSVFVLPFLWSYGAGRYRRPVIIGLYLPLLCGILLLLR